MFKHLLIGAAALCALEGAARADVIASVLETSCCNSGLLLGYNPTTLDLRFTLPAPYHNISISGDYYDLLGGGSASLTAWLMNQVGPGATGANQLASTSFDPGYNPNAQTTVFTGLNLDAGTYDFVITGTYYMVAEHSFYNSSATTTAPGVSFHWYSTAGTIPGYDSTFPPDNTFYSEPYQGWNFQITGDPGAPAPEPASFGLLALGIAALWTWSRRRGLAIAHRPAADDTRPRYAGTADR